MTSVMGNRARHFSAKQNNSAGITGDPGRASFAARAGPFQFVSESRAIPLQSGYPEESACGWQRLRARVWPWSYYQTFRRFLRESKIKSRLGEYCALFLDLIEHSFGFEVRAIEDALGQYRRRQVLSFHFRESQPVRHAACNLH